MPAYCQVSDLYDYGLPRGGLPNPARLIDSVDVASNALTLDEHGFSGGEQVSFRADESGALPAPLTEGTTYYALKVTSSAFRVSATLNGAAIDLTNTGYLVLLCEDLPIQPAINWAGEIINDSLPAHVLPLPTPYPEIIRMTAAELAVGKLSRRQGAANDSLSKTVQDAQARLARWAKGVPLRGTAPETRANLAASASVAYRDPRGWNEPGVI
jgi:hypothetical protein